MSATQAPARSATGLAVCVGAGTVSSLGTSIQAFALGWQTSGFGAHAAGLVATLANLPRVLLMLIGGAAADRHGIRTVMIICDALMAGTLAVTLLYLSLDHRIGLGLVITLTLIGSVVSAFYLPASGGFVRLFVAPDRLARVMARVGSVQQIARLIGPSLAAVLVVIVGLRGVVGFNLISFLVVLVALLIIRPPLSLQTEGVREEKMITGILETFRTAWRTPGMIASLAALGLVAGSVLPILYLIVPLDVRARHWGVTAAGWLESAWIVGTLGVSLVVAVTGPYRRGGLVVMIGAGTAGLGGVVMASAPTIPVALGGAVLMGVGTAAFTGHLTPLYLVWTPPELTARFQSLIVIVQSVAMLVANLPYGLVAGAAGPGAAMITAATICGLACLVVATNRRLRTARNAGPAAT